MIWNSEALEPLGWRILQSPRSRDHLRPVKEARGRRKRRREGRTDASPDRRGRIRRRRTTRAEERPPTPPLNTTKSTARGGRGEQWAEGWQEGAAHRLHCLRRRVHFTPEPPLKDKTERAKTAAAMMRDNSLSPAFPHLGRAAPPSSGVRATQGQRQRRQCSANLLELMGVVTR